MLRGAPGSAGLVPPGRARPAGSPPGQARDGTGRRPARLVSASLLALTKPRIIELLLVTTVPTMMLAAHGLPPLGLLLVTLAGGTLAAGSANTINCYIDRDIDAVMRRTARRPLARPPSMAVIRPAEALSFGIVLGIAATLLLGLLAGWLAAALADAAIVFYVFIYTLGLKRRTASNIVIGGAAGGFPVLVGWAAVTGTVRLPALILFAVIFFWTPPHFWALAMKFRDDYAAAAVPMLPVVAPAWVVARKILLYSYAMVAATLALIPYAGWVYAAGAAGLGAWFLAEAHRLRSRVARLTAGTAAVTPARPDAPGEARTAAGAPDETCAGLTRPSISPVPMRLFHLSIAYLSLLFALTALAAVLPWGRW
ncbi:MAG TPA: heme o synthase [Streptosporangiaceae bacterium]|nr:heme o synthase [Streptosporangiaceae bacterium]